MTATITPTDTTTTAAVTNVATTRRNNRSYQPTLGRSRLLTR